MNFLTYLYYKFYRFQVRVGNGDIALFSSVFFMMVLALFYYWSIQLLIIVIFPASKSWISSYVGIGAVILPLTILLWCWLGVWRGKRYKKIIEYYEKISPKRSLWAVLFAVFSLFSYGLGFLLIILRNNGII